MAKAKQKSASLDSQAPLELACRTCPLFAALENRGWGQCHSGPFVWSGQEFSPPSVPYDWWCPLHPSYEPTRPRP